MPQGPLPEFTCEAFGRAYDQRKDRITAVREYFVNSATDIDNIEDILTNADAATGAIPPMGEKYTTNGPQGLVVIGRRPYEVSTRDKKAYRVRVDYATDIESAEWNISIASIKREYVPWKTQTALDDGGIPFGFQGSRYLGPAGVGGDETISGYAPVNRAGDWFNPPLKDLRYTKKITLRRRISDWLQLGVTPTIYGYLDALMQYEGAMNNAPLQIAGIWGGTWEFRVDSIDLVRVANIDGTFDTDVTIVIIWDPLTHATVAANVGLNEKKPDGSIDAARKKDGTKAQQPAILDENGVALREFTAPSENGPPYYIVFPFPKTINLSILVLPENWGM